jgi:hypothetical protein
MKVVIILSIFWLLPYQGIRCQGRWAQDSSTGFLPRIHHSSVVINGLIYVVGYTSPGIQVFDPKKHQWNSPTTSGYYQPSSLTSSANVINGKIYNIEAYSASSNTFTDSLKLFDPTTNTWSTLTPTGDLVPRGLFASCVVNNKIYLAGGDASDFEFPPIGMLQVYDPATNQWSTPLTNGKITPRYGLTCSAIGDTIYFIGGDLGLPDFPVLNIVEAFDTKTNTWSTPITTGTFTARQYLTSSVVNGKIYVMGGDTAGTINPVNTLEVFDPSNNTWSTPKTTGVFTPRMNLSSSVVDGNIYTFGGYRPHKELNTVEVLYPSFDDVSSPIKDQKISLLSTIVTNSADFQFGIHQSNIKFELYDVIGRLIVRFEIPEGETSLHLNVQKYPAGIYFARIGSEIARFIKK